MKKGDRRRKKDHSRFALLVAFNIDGNAISSQIVHGLISPVYPYPATFPRMDGLSQNFSSGQP